MATAKQPHPARYTAADSPTPLYTAAKQPHPHYTAHSAQSAKQLHSTRPQPSQRSSPLQ